MELKDLAPFLEEANNRKKQIDITTEIVIPLNIWNRIASAYKNQKPSDKVVLIGNHTLQITTSEDSETKKLVYISSQEIIQVWATIPWAREFIKYEDAVEKFAEKISLGKRVVKGSFFENFPSSVWRSNVTSDQIKKVEVAISQLPYDQASKDNFLKFISDPEWSGMLNKANNNSKKLNRSDWVQGSLLNQGGWLAAAADKRGDLIIACVNDAELESLIGDIIMGMNKHAISGGRNVIYYGAPGTGKSTLVKNQVIVARTIRTVFHTDTLNSDFIGCLKPVTSEGGSVTYEFVPGPFAQALALAIKDPSQTYWLVIEEINRAPAAAVFGEVFQLLDRTPEGLSEYEVSFSDPTFQTYLKRVAGYTGDTFHIPSNLSILATMNSSDQGVLPMDTAFKRRWQFTYVPLDFTACPAGNISFKKTDGKDAQVAWADYAQAINKILSSKSIPEDRHLGPFFLTTNDIQSGKDALVGKLFIYLWDDVLRHSSRLSIFTAGINTYGELVTKANTGQQVYSSELLQLLEEKLVTGNTPQAAV